MVTLCPALTYLIHNRRHSLSFTNGIFIHRGFVYRLSRPRVGRDILTAPELQHQQRQLKQQRLKVVYIRVFSSR